VKFPKNKTSSYKRPTKFLAKEYFNSLSKEAHDKLYEKYKHDFELFGYSMQDFL